MYHYVKDKEFLGNMKRVCSDIMNQLKQQINNDSVMQVDIHLVGSGAKNLITQNANEPIDLDYNLCIEKTFDINIRNGRAIKEYIIEQFNYVLNKNGWSNCKDSTSALTTERRYFIKGNHTDFSIDLAIVREDQYGWHRLKHIKTSFMETHQWIWNLSRDSKGLSKKAKAIKDNGLWLEVRECYLKKKNQYLTSNDYDHPSFIIYIETINEVYHNYFQ